MKHRFNLLALILLLALGYTGNASALCVTPTELGELGRWNNIDLNTKSITKADLGFACGDVILNGVVPYTGYQIRLFGSCHPNDCNWGWANIQPDGSGWYRATIDQGFATRYVWVKKYAYWSRDYLRIYIWTDFDSPSRQDYASDGWFLHE